jgi:glycosyltransferase involved in cell wall biosynthesis
MRTSPLQLAIVYPGNSEVRRLATPQNNRHAALFVLPSTHEGLPIAALEAANLNVPMLLSDIRPNLDIDLAPVNYFQSGNSNALAAKLRQNYDSFRIDAGDIGRRFNWGAITAATQKVYAHLAAV